MIMCLLPNLYLVAVSTDAYLLPLDMYFQLSDWFSEYKGPVCFSCLLYTQAYIQKNLFSTLFFSVNNKDGWK